MKFIGVPIKRLEDPRLLVGGGRYVDDLVRPGMAHAVIVRSPHAHARVRRVDGRRALARPGVLAFLTGADLAGVPTIPLRQALRKYNRLTRLSFATRASTKTISASSEA